jgi:hypothetical protein
MFSTELQNPRWAFLPQPVFSSSPSPLQSPSPPFADTAEPMELDLNEMMDILDADDEPEEVDDEQEQEVDDEQEHQKGQEEEVNDEHIEEEEEEEEVEGRFVVDDQSDNILIGFLQGYTETRNWSEVHILMYYIKRKNKVYTICLDEGAPNSPEGTPNTSETVNIWCYSRTCTCIDDFGLRVDETIRQMRTEAKGIRIVPLHMCAIIKEWIRAYHALRKGAGRPFKTPISGAHECDLPHLSGRGFKGALVPPSPPFYWSAFSRLEGVDSFPFKVLPFNLNKWRAREFGPPVKITFEEKSSNVKLNDIIEMMENHLSSRVMTFMELQKLVVAEDDNEAESSEY